MRYTLIQGKTLKDFDKINPAFKQQFNKLDTALKMFNLIKDNQYDYNLNQNECLLTILYCENNILELYRSYPTLRIFKL